MKSIPRLIAPLTFADVLHALRSHDRESADAPLKAFSDQFADFIGVPYAIPAPSARLGLQAILSASDLPPKSEVILPALTFHSIPQVVRDFGLIPLFVDIDPATFLMDPEQIEAAVGPATSAIIPTHLHGRACDMERIGALAKKHGLMVIEDCAQACGGRYGDVRLGGFGDAAIFTFGPTKNLSTLWGGMVTARTPDLAKKIETHLAGFPRISLPGLVKRLVFAMGMRAVTRPLIWSAIMAPFLRLFDAMGTDPIQAATTEKPGSQDRQLAKAGLLPGPFQGRLGLRQLEKLDEANGRRERNGRRLLERLAKVPGIETPSMPWPGECIFLGFPIRLDDREDFRRRLLRARVDSALSYMSVGPLLPGMQSAPDAPAALDAHRRMAHLPVYPEMTDQDVDRIAQAVVKVLARS